MSNLNKREHDIWYPLMIHEYGCWCYMCQKSPLAKTPDLFCPRLLIHEIKYERPLKLENMRPLCDVCNQQIHPERPEKFKREMTPELAINRAKEGPARQYIINRILLDGSESYNKIVNAAAEKVGVSTKTIETYMDKLTSDEGRLIEQFGTVYMRGYEPEMKFDLVSNNWVEVNPAKSIPPEIVKEIQEQLLVKRN